MGSEWRETTVGEFAPFSYGKGLPQRKRNEFGRIPVYGSNGIVGYHDQALLEGPVIIIGRKGTIGAVHYCDDPCWPIDTTFYVTEAEGRDLRFAYYLLKSLGLDRFNFDSAVPGLNRNTAHCRRITVPLLPEQHTIAHILGALDDKIELNRQMNQTLEAIAAAIFKSWFVDFDPMRAKRDGRDSGPPKEIADLFPDRFEDSELGEIPKGWKVSKLGDVIDLAYGKALKASNRIPGNVPVYGSNGPVGFHNEALVKGPGIVVGRKGNPGIVTWSSRDFYPIDTTFYVVPKGSVSSLFYLFYALKAQDLPSLSADSAVPGLNRNLAYMSQVLVPSKLVLSALDKQVIPLFEKIEANEDESHSLSSLRDALLPKLLSGELRVPDAERFIEEADV